MTAGKALDRIIALRARKQRAVEHAAARAEARFVAAAQAVLDALDDDARALVATALAAAGAAAEEEDT